MTITELLFHIAVSYEFGRIVLFFSFSLPGPFSLCTFISARPLSLSPSALYPSALLHSTPETVAKCAFYVPVVYVTSQIILWIVKIVCRKLLPLIEIAYELVNWLQLPKSNLSFIQTVATYFSSMFHAKQNATKKWLFHIYWMRISTIVAKCIFGFSTSIIFLMSLSI